MTNKPPVFLPRASLSSPTGPSLYCSAELTPATERTALPDTPLSSYRAQYAPCGLSVLLNLSKQGLEAFGVSVRKALEAHGAEVKPRCCWTAAVRPFLKQSSTSIAHFPSAAATYLQHRYLSQIVTLLLRVGFIAAGSLWNIHTAPICGRLSLQRTLSRRCEQLLRRGCDGPGKKFNLHPTPPIQTAPFPL